MNTFSALGLAYGQPRADDPIPGVALQPRAHRSPVGRRRPARLMLTFLLLGPSVAACDDDPSAPGPVAPFFDVQITGALDSGFVGVGYLIGGPDASDKDDARADSVLRLMLRPGDAPPGTPTDPFVPESYVRIWLARPGPVGPAWVGRYMVGPGHDAQARLVLWRTNGGTHRGELFAIDGELELTDAGPEGVGGQLTARMIGSLDGLEGAPDTVRVRSRFHLRHPVAP